MSTHSTSNMFASFCLCLMYCLMTTGAYQGSEYEIQPLANYMAPFGAKAISPKYSYRNRAELSIYEPNNYNVAFLVQNHNLPYERYHGHGGFDSRPYNEPRPSSKPRSFFPPKEIEAQLIDIEAPSVPLVLSFQTRSSKIMALQNHIPHEAEEVKETESIEKPHKLVHVVVRPIISEIKEIITPFRKIIQQIKPVQEEVITIIAQQQKPRAISASGLLGIVGSSIPLYRPSYFRKYSRKP